MRRWLSAAGRAGWTVGLAGVWSAAVVAGALAGWQADRAFTAHRDRAAAGQAAQASQVQLAAAALQRDDYNRIARRLQPLHPDIEFTPSDQGITLSAKQLDRYEQWRFAINDLLSAMPGVKWQAQSICMGSKCGAMSFMAQLDGTRQTLQVQ